MLTHGESFWSAVYPVFMSRELTRADLRRIVQVGLETTNGNYRLLVQLFNMPQEDYKRFLSFLRKHDCHLPFQRFRTAPARLQGPLAPLRAGAKGGTAPQSSSPRAIERTSSANASTRLRPRPTSISKSSSRTTARMKRRGVRTARCLPRSPAVSGGCSNLIRTHPARARAQRATRHAPQPH